ncbi:MAG: class I SAM-dependent methyltransferase, partial [Planctomycetes bacterium]|nr:class I SAM-dependent methyltransferase [Planctomycetota bacterium]
MTYQLLDSGHGRKLERLGPVVVDRQAPGAFWRPRLDRQDWDRSNGVHHRSNQGGGHWEWKQSAPAPWTIEHGTLKFQVKPTPFGHMGLFPEQVGQWHWLGESIDAFCRSKGRAPALLNLFAYTGGSTLAAARAGAEVTHVDAARGVVDWARVNAELNDLGNAPVRWIVDDCSRYLERELRRKKRYDGVILDPPTFGRGVRGETWKI